jgi:hypothetical protein
VTITSRAGGTRLAVVAIGIVLVSVLAPHRAPAHDDGPSAIASSASRLSDRQVLAISIDGFNVRALQRLGRQRAPHLHRLLSRGARTRNARTQVEMTVTLPNHTSMVTGRRIGPGHGGHGVDWNSDIPGTTVQAAAGGQVASIFTRVHRAGGSTAVFSTKTKFSLFDRSWPRAINRSTIKEERDRDLVLAVRRDLLRHDRAFTFLHLGAPDAAGHARGWLSPAYLRAVEQVDGLLGLLLRAIHNHNRLSDVVIVLTSDHGGVSGARGHAVKTKLANYRIPFLIWGPGVDRGNLYTMNPTYADPGRSRPHFNGTQPIRNGDLANVCANLLGLTSVPGSLWGHDQTLTWHD